MKRPVVKICGLMREEEVETVCNAGVDFYGLQVDVASPWAVSIDRARKLAACGQQRAHAMLVTGPTRHDKLVAWIRDVGVSAIQLPALTSPALVRQLRADFSPQALTILQAISYRQGGFLNEDQFDDYLAAGADYILIDKFEKTPARDPSVPTTIPPEALAAFRARHFDKPFLLAGGVSPDNVTPLMAASGAAGIDVCTSVRRDGAIQRDRLDELLRQLHDDRSTQKRGRPSLREFLNSVGPGNHVIAYLTLGDPAQAFLETADAVLAAGALTLELGFPSSDPKEGAVLRASHERALRAGVEWPIALEMFRAVAQRHPGLPLVAVVQWPAAEQEGRLEQWLDAIAEAGAAAVLPVGVSVWQYPSLAALVHQRGLQTVLPCPPSASRKLRQIVVRFCSGCLYVPRGRVTGSAKEFGNYAEFCRQLAAETETPMIVGVGVRNAADVSEICSTPAKAAAVGTALVEHLVQGGRADDFVRSLRGLDAQEQAR